MRLSDDWKVTPACPACLASKRHPDRTSGSVTSIPALALLDKKESGPLAWEQARLS